MRSTTTTSRPLRQQAFEHLHPDRSKPDDHHVSAHARDPSRPSDCAMRRLDQRVGQQREQRRDERRAGDDQADAERLDAERLPEKEKSPKPTVATVSTVK